nr:acyl carrier protein 2, mitochondrial-like [Tanacetum cinerariifolium]
MPNCVNDLNNIVAGLATDEDDGLTVGGFRTTRVSAGWEAIDTKETGGDYDGDRKMDDLKLLYRAYIAKHYQVSYGERQDYAEGEEVPNCSTPEKNRNKSLSIIDALIKLCKRVLGLAETLAETIISTSFFVAIVTPTFHSQNDIGLDSLNRVKVVISLEEEFGYEIPDNKVDKFSTINIVV